MGFEPEIPQYRIWIVFNNLYGLLEVRADLDMPCMVVTWQARTTLRRPGQSATGYRAAHTAG